jgi:putative membrane protein
MNKKPFRERRLLQALFALYLIFWIAAAIHPVNRGDWLLENLLVLIGLPVLALAYRRAPFSNTTCILTFLFLILHGTGAHYTYSEVPIGFWLKDAFQLRRNHFDRIVHFSFGLLLTYPVLELLRGLAKMRRAWALIAPLAIITSFSGLFEIIEAIVAWIVEPDLGAAYLGTQGDVWDAQKDMGLAIVGATLVICLIAAAKRDGKTRGSH